MLAEARNWMEKLDVRGKAKGSSRPALTFTEQFYFPEGWGGAQLLQDVTIHLASEGFAVRVVCGSDVYAPLAGDAGRNPADHGVSIIRLPRLLGGEVHSRKLLRQLWFYALTLPTTLLGPRPELYVTQTNPPLIVPIIAFVSWARGVPLLVIAQDLYPELVVAHGMLRADSVQSRMLERTFSWAYRQAAGVVSLGPAMTKRLLAKGVSAERITEIPNWAAGPQNAVRGAQNKLRSEWGLNDKFVLLYSGNLGVAHDIATTISALREAVKERPEIRLVIIGNGVRIPEAKRLVQEQGLEEYVLFKALVPTEMLPHSIGLADLALVTLKNDFEGLVVPSKLLGYMARGIPTLYIGPPSEVSATLAASHGGVSFATGDVTELKRELVARASDPGSLVEMGAAAKRYYEKHLTRERALRRYGELVQQLHTAHVVAHASP
jgi:colanic acid biosynthesis glycosyl transferase WcaI